MKLVSASLVLSLVFPALAVAQDDKPLAAKPLAAKSPLIGKWIQTTSFRGGDQVKDPFIRGDLVFEADKVVLHFDRHGGGGSDNKAEGTYTYDAKSKPARIVFEDVKPVGSSAAFPDGFPKTLITMFEGETLVIAYDTKGGVAPDKFTTAADNAWEVVNFAKRKE
jgi:uncharacterized protein (TIGR03067 family)